MSTDDIYWIDRQIVFGPNDTFSNYKRVLDSITFDSNEY